MQILDEILALTEAVERHVERGEWSEAGQVDGERCRLLAGLLSDPQHSVDRTACREILQGLLIRNQATVQRLQSQQGRLLAEANAAQKYAGAMRAYRRNSDPDNLVYLRKAGVNEP